MAMPRCIQITAYEEMPKRLDRLRVYLDVNEVEAISSPSVGPYQYWIFMKSGKRWLVDSDSYERIEKAITERE